MSCCACHLSKLVNPHILTVFSMGLHLATCAEHMSYCLCMLKSLSFDVKHAIRQMHPQKARTAA
jgi:hypothetical protein